MISGSHRNPPLPGRNRLSSLLGRRPNGATPPEADDDSTSALRNQVLQIAWPVIVENLLQTGLNVVNFWMISRLGVEAIAGVGTAQQYLMTSMAALGAIGIGSSVLISHAIGSRDLPAAGRVAKQSLELALIIGLVIGVLGNVFAYQANLTLGLTPDVAEIGAVFLRIVASGAVMLVLMFICAAILRGTGDSKTPMQINLFSNGVGAISSYCLIFGVGPFPGIGVAGSAVGPLIAWSVASLLLLRVLLFKRTDLRLLSRAGWRPNPMLIKRILTIGIPSGVEQFAVQGGFLLLTGIIAAMGTSVLAAHRVVFQALGFSNMPGMGFGVAATTITGIQMGARRVDLAEKATWIATRWALTWMCAIAALLFFFAEPFMMLFASGQPDVVHYGAQVIKIMAFTQPFFALTNGLSGGLRGAGDTRFPMVLSALGVWLIRLPGAYILGLTFGLGLVGVYLASVIDAATRSMIFLRRYRSEKWRKLDVLKGMRREPARGA